MADITKGYPIVYRFGGDTLDEFAQKYMKEIDRIYYLMNNIRKMSPSDKYGVGTSPFQFAVIDGKLHIRNEENTDWIYLGDLRYNFGFTVDEGERVLTTDDLTDVEGEVGKIPVTDETGRLRCNITGDVGKIGGYGIRTCDIQDGQGLYYNVEADGWKNESKGDTTASTLTIRDGNNILAIYDGSEPKEFDVDITAQREAIETMKSEASTAIVNVADKAIQDLQTARDEAVVRLDNLENKLEDDLTAHDESNAAHQDIRDLIDSTNTRIAAMQTDVSNLISAVDAIQAALGI